MRQINVLYVSNHSPVTLAYDFQRGESISLSVEQYVSIKFSISVFQLSAFSLLFSNLNFSTREWFIWVIKEKLKTSNLLIMLMAISQNILKFAWCIYFWINPTPWNTVVTFIPKSKGWRKFHKFIKHFRRFWYHKHWDLLLYLTIFGSL